jgi:hypothetical protein
VKQVTPPRFRAKWLPLRQKNVEENLKKTLEQKTTACSALSPLESSGL